jgi:hypothetical protein
MYVNFRRAIVQAIQSRPHFNIACAANSALLLAKPKRQLCCIMLNQLIGFLFFFVALQPKFGLSRVVFKVFRSHTIRHAR